MIFPLLKFEEALLRLDKLFITYIPFFNLLFIFNSTHRKSIKISFFFKWNFEYVYDLWDDLLNKPLVGKRPAVSLRIKYREIIRIIRRYHSSHLPGASRSDIIGEAKTNPLETEQLIDECSNSGIIYQPVAGFYRLTRDDA